MNELIQYYMTNGSYVLSQIVRHFLMSFYGVLFACLIGIPLGFYIANRKGLSRLVRGTANIIQTIPSLAMLSLLMIVMGLGPMTVVVSIFLYSLLPIISNTVAGVRSVDENVLDVAKGMGMTPRQIVFRVKLPLAMSIMIGGVRNALVVAIGVAAVGTFIGAGGLGDIISRGITVANGSSIVWAGALPTALMAMVTDLALGRVEKKLTVSSSSI